MLKYYEQQVKVAGSALRAERSKLWPDLSFGFTTQTLQGTGADNKFYTSSDRFNTAGFGLGIPLFFGAQNARIRSGKVRLKMAENKMEQQRIELSMQLNAAMNNFEKYAGLIAGMEKNLLPNADMLLQTADKQFVSGQINYLEWTLLTDQALRIKNNYLETVTRMNENAIEINYLQTK
jgi:cobalt-zinc-cadmium resistance protein CzcA